MPSRILVALAALLLFGNAEGWAQADRVRVTYLANEGVLLAHGETEILIDGLHRPYKPAYDVLPPPERARLETAQPPYDGVDAVLVSHIHRDHFSAEAVGRHLRHNPGAVLVSSQQVVDSLRRGFEGFGKLGPRIHATTPAPGNADTVRVGEAEIIVLRIRHVNARFEWVQNLGHLVRLGGKTFLHVGDAAVDPAVFAPFGLADAEIDVALLPAWFLLDEAGRRLVREHIRPRHLVAVHVSPGDEAVVERRIRAALPGVRVFRKKLETRLF